MGLYSHVKQLSLDFVENVILHLFVLAVASVGTIAWTSTNFIDPVLELLVKLGTEARRFFLLDLQVTLMFLYVVVDSLRSPIGLPVHVAFLELRGAKEVHPDL